MSSCISYFRKNSPPQVQGEPERLCAAQLYGDSGAGGDEGEEQEAGESPHQSPDQSPVTRPVPPAG